MKKIIFIINPKSGTGKYSKAKELIPQKIDSTKFEYQIIETEYKGHAKLITKEAVNNDIDIVVSVGGDGTLNEITKILANTNTCLGIIPTGSGNGLAHHLHIPFNIEKALEVINEYYSEKIDTMLLNNKRVVSIAGVGFDAYVAWHYDKTTKRGFWPYFRLAFVNFFSYKSKKYTLSIDHEQYHRKALFVSFANSSQWGYNTQIAPHASLQDGKFDICIFKKPNLFEAISLMPKLFSGKIDQSSKMEIIQCKKAIIWRNSKKKMHIHIDGEKKKRKKIVEVIIDSQSLNIIIPKR